jgi:hypothetical protein
MEVLRIKGWPMRFATFLELVQKVGEHPEKWWATRSHPGGRKGPKSWSSVPPPKKK